MPNGTTICTRAAIIIADRLADPSPARGTAKPVLGIAVATPAAVVSAVRGLPRPALRFVDDFSFSRKAGLFIYRLSVLCSAHI